MEFIEKHYDTLTSQMAPSSSTCYYEFQDETKRPFLLILPGGGYSHLSSDKEGSAIANWGKKQGFHTGIFSYQVNPVNLTQLKKDCQELLNFLKEKPISKLLVMGFSAGSHLAGLLSIMGEEQVAATIYCYPVVTFEKPYAHEGSVKNFLQEEISPATRKKYSLNHCLTEKVAPAFIWHTFEDQAVPLENSLLLAKKYHELKIPCEYHGFPEGRHGLGMLPEVPHTLQWVDLLEKWLKEEILNNH